MYILFPQSLLQVSVIENRVSFVFLFIIIISPFCRRVCSPLPPPSHEVQRRIECSFTPPAVLVLQPLELVSFIVTFTPDFK